MAFAALRPEGPWLARRYDYCSPRMRPCAKGPDRLAGPLQGWMLQRAKEGLSLLAHSYWLYLSFFSLDAEVACDAVAAPVAALLWVLLVEASLAAAAVPLAVVLAAPGNVLEADA